MGFPKDFMMSATEILSLYDAMCEVARKTGNVACIDRLKVSERSVILTV